MSAETEAYLTFEGRGRQRIDQRLQNHLIDCTTDDNETPQHSEVRTCSVSLGILTSEQHLFVRQWAISVNKSAQSNLGTGPRRGSCARRWLA